jgi:hypothetical protein
MLQARSNLKVIPRDMENLLKILYEVKYVIDSQLDGDLGNVGYRV